MDRRFFLILALAAVLLMVFGYSCGGGSSSDQTTTPSLTTLQDMPELDVSKYDTSSSYYSAPSSSVSAEKDIISKTVTQNNEFSRTGCEVKSMKNFMLNMGIIAEGFMCLYKITEEYYPTTFSIPTGSFSYYSIQEDEGTMLSRIGYYPNGYGNTSDAVLVIDECEYGADQTAEMRVTAQEVTQSITGAGYYILLTETESWSGESELFTFEIDTRNDDWQFSGQFNEGNGTEYGNISLSYDVTDEYNTMSGFCHESGDEDAFDVQMNVVFGQSGSLPSGFTAGGTAHTLVQEGENINDNPVDSFVFNDSSSLPAIVLTSDADDNTELPYYSDMIDMGDLPTISAPSINFADGWNCEVEAGSSFVTIDLTPTEIAAAVDACEAAEDAVVGIDDTCDNLEEQQD